MRILVTGASGFIGAEVMKLAASRGHEVIGVDSYSQTLYSAETKRARAEELETLLGRPVIESDLSSENIEAHLEGVECVINEMAIPGLKPSWTETHSYFNSNVIALSKLLDSIKKTGVRRIVHASTSSVYGNWSQNKELRPISPYGVSKLAAENMISAHQKEFDFEATVLRYFSVYGPNQRPDMAYAKFIDAALRDQEIKIYGDGSQQRTNTHVRDVAMATVIAAESEMTNFTADISGEELVSLNEAIKQIEQSLGFSIKKSHAPRQLGDQSISKGDNALAQDLLGWKNEISFAKGIAEQVNAAKSITSVG